MPPLNTDVSPWMGPLFVLLGAMNSAQGWGDAHRRLYAAVLNELGCDLATDAVNHAALHEEWRPAPARLRRLAVQMSAPYPDAETCYAEIMFQAQQTGLYGQPDPVCRNWYNLGAPPMSHPLVSEVIARVGGWEAICTAEEALVAALPNMVRRAHEGLAAQWESDVAAQWCLPPHRRNPRLFAKRKLFTPPAWFVPPVAGERLALPAFDREDDEAERVPMPEEIRARLEGLGLMQIGRLLT